jgi:hypothetical protein
MENIIFSLKTQSGFELTHILIVGFLFIFAVYHTYFILLPIYNWIKIIIFGRNDDFVHGAKPCPTGIVIIPSLLRNENDFQAIIIAAESCAKNQYPNKLIIIASVDGRKEQPTLYNKLIEWSKKQIYPSNIFLYITGTDIRGSKMMAIDAAITYMHTLIETKVHEQFPKVYFSADGDGILSTYALERLAIKLLSPHPLTGNPRRIVSGKICIRPDIFWQGWKTFFTIRGQMYIQVAREFVVSNVRRYNWSFIVPQMSMPGALYCTYSELLIKAPKYMGFLQTIKYIDWIKWWFGVCPPKFTESKALPIPEAMTGSTDDTTMAFFASVVQWHNGQFMFNFPRTPLHAFWRLIVAFCFERSNSYEPEARVYTYTPETIKSLFTQRVRWNSSRYECAGRFFRSFLFHWDTAFPVISQLLLLLQGIIQAFIYYVLFPFFVFKTHNIFCMILIGYLSQIISDFIYTSLALLVESDYKRYSITILAVPLANLYNTYVNLFAAIWGIGNDLLIFGSRTKFVPEETLIKGKSSRIALLYRIRRFISMCIRSVWHGDVPFGIWWFGFREHHPYVDSGYKNWTSNKRR